MTVRGEGPRGSSAHPAEQDEGADPLGKGHGEAMVSRPCASGPVGWRGAARLPQPRILSASGTLCCWARCPALSKDACSLPHPAPWSGQLSRPRAADVTRANPQPGRAALARHEGSLRVQKAACLCVCMSTCACVRVSTCARRCVFLSLRPLLSWGKCSMVTRVQSVLEGLQAEPGEGLCHT